MRAGKGLGFVHPGHGVGAHASDLWPDGQLSSARLWVGDAPLLVTKTERRQPISHRC